jgi:hypothetical protein
MPERTRPGGNGRGKGTQILVSPLADAIDDDYRRLWHDRAMPELLWIAELLPSRPLREGFRLAIAVASAARGVAEKGAFTLYAAAGSYASLDPDRFAALRRQLADRDALAPVAAALGELVALFPAYPLAPLLEGGAPPGAPAASFGKLRGRLEAMSDPCSRLSLRVQLVVLWQAVQAGVLRGGSTAKVAELAHASRFPITPESVPAARQVLGLAAQLLQLEQILPATSWPDQFWSRFSELERKAGA